MQESLLFTWHKQYKVGDSAGLRKWAHRQCKASMGVEVILAIHTCDLKTLRKCAKIYKQLLKAC